MAEKLIKKINFHMVIQAILFFVLIAADRFTKFLAFNSLKDSNPIPVIDGIVEFQYLENTGAAFGIFKNQQWMFYIVTVIILVVVISLWVILNSKSKKYIILCSSDPEKYLARTYNGNIFLGYLLSILCAGAVGNLIDRIFQKYVIDFIYFKIIDFPIFNFADICVTLMAIAFIIYFLFIYKEDPNFSIFGKTKKEKASSWEIIEETDDSSSSDK